MKLRKIILKLKVCVVILALPSLALAEGAIGFLLSPATSTLVAGQPFSWMEVGTDWNKVTTHPGAGGFQYATPTVPQNVTIDSFRTGSSLRLTFTIDDQTPKKPDLTSLLIGDKVIIQIDPNNSGHGAVPSTNLSPGPDSDINTDYRFEVVIRDNARVDAETGFKLPQDLGGGTIIWGSLTSQPTIATVAPKGGPPGYIVDVTIPLALIGSPMGDIGIAIGVINDVGHDHIEGGATIPDVTGTVFPFSMGLTAGSDPGLIASGQDSGAWQNPARWGVGYFNLAPGDVTFTHMPVYYFSKSLKLSVCDAPNFAGVGEAGVSIDQLTLANWYQYFPGKPCKMKIWFRTFKAGAGVAKRRFVIVWGRPGVSPQDWFLVTLTPPVTLTLADEVNSFVWVNPPAVNFTSHPCMRIYVLPEILDPSFNEVAINGIDTQAELSMMETTYGISPGADFHSAQMNFTALHTGSCPAGTCAQAQLLKRDDLIATTGGAAQFGENGWQLPLSMGTGPSEAQPQDGGQTNGQTNKEFVRIIVEEFGIPVSRDPKKRYTYIERLGGIGWAIRSQDLAQNQKIELQMTVSNPLVFQRDFSAKPPVDIKSPPRTILLDARAEAPQGIPKPTVVVRLDKQTLNPGETTTAVVTVTQGQPPKPDNRLRFGLSLHAGVAIPHGDFNTIFDPGPNFAVDLEYRLTPIVSLEAIYGLHHFAGGTLGQVTVGDLNLHQFSFNGKVYGTTSPVRPFFDFGGGAYKFGSGGSTRGGINIGGGLQFDVTPNFAFEGLYNFHNVFTSSSNVRFSALQAGVRFRF